MTAKDEFLEYCDAVRFKSRHKMQVKVRREDDKYVVYWRWYDFVDNKPDSEWHCKFNRPSECLMYPDVGMVFKKIKDLCPTIETRLCSYIFKFDSLYEATCVAKVLTDFFQPFRFICDMYDEQMRTVYTIENAAYVLWYDEKRYKLMDVKRGVRIEPDCREINVNKHYQQLLTVLKRNAIFPTDYFIK